MIGKTTMIHEAISSHLEHVGGFCVERKIENGERIGFYLIAMKDRPKFLSGQDFEQNLFLKRKGDTLNFNQKPFVDYLLPILTQELAMGKKLFVLDEIGGVELSVPVIKDILFAIIGSGTPCLGVYKHQKNTKNQKRCIGGGDTYDTNRNELKDTIKNSDGLLVNVTMENRETMAEALVEHVKKIMA